METLNLLNQVCSTIKDKNLPPGASDPFHVVNDSSRPTTPAPLLTNSMLEPPLPLASQTPIEHNSPTTTPPRVPTPSSHLLQPPYSSQLADPSPTDLPTPHRRPRQAATKAHYDLSAQWSSFTAYLTESSSSDSSGSSNATPFLSSTRRRRGRRTDEKSEDESDSDEYMTDDGGGRGKRGGGKGVARGGGRQGKRRKVERLGKGDWEIIGKRGRGRGGKGGKGLRGLTRGEARRLVGYVLEKTDWKGAAAYVCGAGDAKVETREEERVGKVAGEEAVMRSEEGQEMMNSDRLKLHWKDALSKKVVDLYID